jgi:polyisoprenoid-binding protein YceI
MTTNQTLDERYGRKRSRFSSRAKIWVAAIALLGVFFGWATWVTFFSPAAAAASVAGYDVIDSSHTVIRFTVDKPAGRKAVCAARVMNKAFSVVGYKEVSIARNQDASGVITVSVNTTEAGVSGLVDRCWLK